MASPVIEIVGWIGTVLIVGAYFLLTGGKLKSDSAAYQGMNLLGALGIVVNALANNAYPPAALNITWSFIAVYGLVKAFRA